MEMFNSFLLPNCKPWDHGVGVAGGSRGVFIGVSLIVGVRILVGVLR
jgi:hypothetical protein